MKNSIKFFTLFLVLSIPLSAQLHDYKYKFGFQTGIVIPRTEFDSDIYQLSLLGRGFVKTELISYLELEIGTGIAELRGKDFSNDNWRTVVFPTDFRIVLNPVTSTVTSTYFYSGLTLLKWEIKNLPQSQSKYSANIRGWNIGLPLGIGLEIKLNLETLLNISTGYTFALQDDLNHYNDKKSNDGYFEIGFGLTFVSGGSLTDVDNDGLTELEEIKLGTNPNLRDTDQDNLSDGDELNIYKTNPLSKDTDLDGISDFEEIKRYFSDPLSPDTDGDTILDGIEVNKYGSNPNSKDSDNDKLTDGYEVNIYGTNPANNDSDSDNLNDYDELNKFNTNPLNRDTDGDGKNDDVELFKLKTDPLKINIFENKLKKNKNTSYINNQNSIILENVNFDAGESEIDVFYSDILNQTFLKLRNDPTLSIEIRGYTDSTGTAEYNKKLSQQRVDAVRIWLVKKGIDALRIKAVGLGENNPIASNSTPEGRKNNRRIEIIINK